jgi:hypothetical protein
MGSAGCAALNLHRCLDTWELPSVIQLLCKFSGLALRADGDGANCKVPDFDAKTVRWLAEGPDLKDRACQLNQAVSLSVCVCRHQPIVHVQHGQRNAIVTVYSGLGITRSPMSPDF